jgi:transcriptional regulator with XRE-family HTH domain
MENIGQKILTIREKLGMTQAEFANRIGISRTHVSNLESSVSQPSSALLRFICKEYGVREDWLRYGVEPIFEVEKIQEAKQLHGTPASKVEALEQYKTVDLFHDTMDDHRMQVGGAIAINVDTAAYNAFNALLDKLTGKRIMDNERMELSDTVSNVIAEEQGIFYRYGVHDTVKFILESIAMGNLQPIGSGPIETLVNRICREDNGQPHSA